VTFGQVAVVGHDDRFRVVVETTDRIKITLHARLREHLDDRLAPLGIRSCVDDAARLTSGKHLRSPLLEATPVHTDVVDFRVRARAEFTGHLPVHFNAALADQFPATAA
jgi:hypothetical protein